MSFLGVESQLLRESALGESNQAGVEHEVTLSNRFERVLTGIEVVLDWLTVVLAVSGGYAAYHFLNLGKRLCYNFSTLAYISCAVALLYVILLDRDGAYRPGNSLLRIKETERSLRVSAQAFLLIFPVTFFSSYLFSRWVFFIAALCVPLLQVIEKQLLFICVDALRARNIGVQNVLIYGAGANGRRILSALLRSRKLGLKPVALVDDNPAIVGREVFEYAYRQRPSRHRHPRACNKGIDSTLPMWNAYHRNSKLGARKVYRSCKRGAGGQSPACVYARSCHRRRVLDRTRGPGWHHAERIRASREQVAI